MQRTQGRSRSNFFFFLAICSATFVCEHETKMGGGQRQCKLNEQFWTIKSEKHWKILVLWNKWLINLSIYSISIILLAWMLAIQKNIVFWRQIVFYVYYQVYGHSHLDCFKNLRYKATKTTIEATNIQCN